MHTTHSFYPSSLLSIQGSSDEKREVFKLVVYGTLKRGHWNNKLLDKASFEGPIEIPNFKLVFSSGDFGFPVAVPDKNSSFLGELYYIEPDDFLTINSLDRLEGEGVMYDRTTVNDGLQLYVGNSKFWNNFEDLTDCPKTDKNVYIWG